jgi:hypothetical protein
VAHVFTRFMAASSDSQISPRLTIVSLSGRCGGPLVTLRADSKCDLGLLKRRNHLFIGYSRGPWTAPLNIWAVGVDSGDDNGESRRLPLISGGLLREA